MIHNQSHEEQLKKIFLQHDKNGDGCLDKNELVQAFKELGAVIPELRAWRGLKNADANGDGIISQDELDHLVRYTAQFGFSVKY